MNDDCNPFEESDFEYHRSRRERNPEAIEQRRRELKEPGAWINARMNRQPFDGRGTNDDAFEAQEARREALALERRDRLWDMPLHHEDEHPIDPAEVRF